MKFKQVTYGKNDQDGELYARTTVRPWVEYYNINTEDIMIYCVTRLWKDPMFSNGVCRYNSTFKYCSRTDDKAYGKDDFYRLNV